MILAIDIGNTNIVIGCIDGSECVFVVRISTVRSKTVLEYSIDIKNVMDIYHIKRTELEGGIISSVVPEITTAAKLAVEKILKTEVLVVGAGIKTGLNIRIDNPAQLGSDLVVDSVAGIAELTAHASQLGGIGLEAPEHIVGKNTVECMKSGIIYSSAAAIDGIIDRLEEELGAGMTVIATGGLARKIVPYCRRKIILDETLLLKGLAIIYRKIRR